MGSGNFIRVICSARVGSEVPRIQFLGHSMRGPLKVMKERWVEDKPTPEQIKNFEAKFLRRLSEAND